MKTFAFILAFALTTMSGLFAQDNGKLFTAEIKPGEIPKEITSAIEKDFPNMIAKNFKSVPGEFIDGSFVLSNNEPMDQTQSYQIYLDGKGFNATAWYDAHGHLLSAREFWKNKALPENVSKAIGNLYPGWALSSDYERIAINKWDDMNTYYRILLKKGHEKIRVTVDKAGNEVSKRSNETM